MSFDRELVLKAKEVLDLCRSSGLKLATAESCTGGLVAAVLTAVPGSSEIVEAGLVTYSNAAKRGLLGVQDDLMETHGAVSEQAARAMAEGALARTNADIAVSTTGIAGPGGGSPEKPVGLVHFACARRARPTLHRRRLFGDPGRDRVRELSVLEALDLVLEQTGKGGLLA